MRLDVVVHGSPANPWEKRWSRLHEESDQPITPALVCEKFPGLKASDIGGIEVMIEGDGTTLTVEGFAFCILKPAALTPLKIAAVRVGKCRDYCKLVSMCLGRLDADESNLLLAACEIRDLNVGLKTNQQKFREGLIDGIEDMRLLTVDIRESQIAKARICVPLKILNVEGATVSRISIESPVEVMEIAQDSELTRLTILDSIGHLDLTHSVVGNLYLHAPIRALKMESSVIQHAHDCHADSFTTRSTQTWKLIMESALASHNYELHKLAAYEFMRLRTREVSKRKTRIAYLLLEGICGYGLKPSRALLTACTVCTVYGLLYALLHWCFGPALNLLPATLAFPVVVWRSLYFSCVTFACLGYGDVLPISLPAQALAMTETMLGISLTSIFVVSLFKKYGN
jgi:hypothetical protein